MKIPSIPNPYLFAGLGIAALAIVVALFLFFRNAERGEIREEGNLRNQGGTEERLKTNEETINAVTNARAPVTDAERNSVCSRFDRNAGANCP